MTRPRHPLRRRLLGALAAYAVGVGLLFALLAMALVYSVEDRFIERMLAEEARTQRAHFATHGRWAAPAGPGIQLHLSQASLPADLARVLAAEPRRTETAGDAGRHYHLLALQAQGQPPWLVAEVGAQLIVRPMRQELLRWLAAAMLTGLAAAAALAVWLARRLSAPLEQLAARVAGAAPGRQPLHTLALSADLPDDEVAVVARSFEALLARTQAFLAREQAFTRDASHELRTPVAVLRAAIERLQADGTLGGGLQQQLAAMHAATLLMQRTIETLLLLAREPADAVADAVTARHPPVPLLPLAERWVLAHARWLDGQALTLDLQLRRSDALALPEPVLELVLASLLGNAFAHGAPGGVVTVAMAEGALCIRNPVAVPEPAPRPGRGGLGLGLAIVRRLVARHGAGIALNQADGVMRAVVTAGTGGAMSAYSARAAAPPRPP